MKKSILAFVVFCLYGFVAWTYPEIVSWQNSPMVVFDNKKQAILVKKGLLKRPFAVVNAPKDEIEFKVNHFDKIFLYENTKAQILDFANEGELVGDFYLLEGKLRYVCDFKPIDKTDTELILKTPFFNLLVNRRVDFFIELNMNEAWVDIKVVKGTLPLEFFSYEKKLELTEGQQVRFQGELSEDKQSIKYDYLLNSKKAPRGQLLEVQKFDHEAYLKADEDARMLEAKRKKEIEKKRLEKIRKQKEYEDSFLCKKPFGQKNQCTWWVEGDKCYRKRCNASGQWGDKIQRPISVKCKPDFNVSECDY